MTSWWAIIPVYNLYVLVKLVGWSGWTVLLLVPLASIVAWAFLSPVW